MDETVLNRISEQGFYEYPRSRERSFGNLRDLIEIMKPTSIEIHKLHPRKATEARRNSLSANHGMGQFPPHTDFAYRSIPPRYIALFCPVSRPGCTTLYNGYRLQEGIQRSGTFRIFTRSRAYSVNFVSNTPRGKLIRYNSDIMNPLDENASRLATVVEQAEPDHLVDWNSVSWVLIDNWKILHGRQPVNKDFGWLWRLALETHE